MTAFGLLKIYCVIAFVLYFFMMLKAGTSNGLLISGIISVLIGTLVLYGFGWLFIIGGKWIMAQFGIVAANDIVYTIIYIILTAFGGVGSRTYYIR